jgi:hypothetical protein
MVAGVMDDGRGAAAVDVSRAKLRASTEFAGGLPSPDTYRKEYSNNPRHYTIARYYSLPIICVASHDFHFSPLRRDTCLPLIHAFTTDGSHHSSPREHSHMFKAQTFRRSFSLFRRIPTSKLLRSAAHDGHETVQVQRVRIKKRLDARL